MGYTKTGGLEAPVIWEVMDWCNGDPPSKTQFYSGMDYNSDFPYILGMEHHPN